MESVLFLILDYLCMLVCQLYNSITLFCFYNFHRQLCSTTIKLPVFQCFTPENVSLMDTDLWVEDRDHEVFFRFGSSELVTSFY